MKNVIMCTKESLNDNVDKRWHFYYSSEPLKLNTILIMSPFFTNMEVSKTGSHTEICVNITRSYIYNTSYSDTNKAPTVAPTQSKVNSAA